MTRTTPHDVLHDFVRHRLQCSCPEDVLRSITCNDDAALPGLDGPLTRLDVGGRLLVYVLPTEGRPYDLEQTLRAAAAAGVEERDRLGFNRLRVVIPVSRRSDLGAAAAAAASTAGSTPLPRVHIHVLESSSLPFGIE